MRAHPVGPQIQHLLLEHVLHLPARAIEFFVEPGRREARSIFVAFETLGRQVGHDETRVGACAVTSALPITRRARLQLWTV